MSIEAWKVSRRAAAVVPKRDIESAGAGLLRQLTRGAAVMAALLGWGPAALQGAEPLHTMAEVYTLSQADALSGQPFLLRGEVVCYDAEWHQLFIQNRGEIPYFDPGAVGASAQPGDQVELTGTTTWTDSHAGVKDLQLKVLRHGSLPQAPLIGAAQLLAMSGRWVGLEARVRTVETSKGRLGLVLESQDKLCVSYVMGGPVTNDALSYLGATVRVQGICTGVPTDHSYSFPTLLIPGLAQVTVTRPAAVPARQIPVSSIEGVLSRPFGPWTNEVVHVLGRAVASRPGDSLIVRDGTGVLRARTLQLNQVEADARVQVWGYLRLQGDEAILDPACFETLPGPGTVAAVGSPPRAPVTHQPSLTRVAEMAGLTGAEAAQGRPVDLTGVVTYADAQWGVGFLQDGTDAVCFELRQTNVSGGTWVRVRGRTDQGQFAPLVTNTKVQVLGRTNFPVPFHAELRDLADGHLDCRWIEVEGFVRRAVVDSGHLRLRLVTPSGGLRAIVPLAPGQGVPAGLLDGHVRLRGVCAAELNPRSQLSGILVHVPGPDWLEIVEPAPANPFAIATTPIGAVATFDPARRGGHRLKVAGTVTLVEPGEACFLQDETGGIRIATPETASLQAGDRVEVLGYPVLGEFTPQLEEPVWRKLPAGARPSPVRTTAEQILVHGTNDAALVQIEAQLLQEPVDAARPQLVLRAGAAIFTAQVLSRAAARQALDWRAGSWLRLTGVCSMQGSGRHEPQGFRLLVNSPKGLVVLATPPLLSWHQVSWIAGGLLVGGVLVMGWILSLRRQVAQRTAQLAYERDLLSVLLENLPDAVYFKDGQSRFVRVSRSFTRLFNVPDPKFIEGKTDSDFFSAEHARPAFEDEQGIMRSGTPIVGKVEKETHLDGRVTWALTSKMPWRDEHGRIVGTFGVSKDITPMKLTEQKVEALHKQLLATSRQAGMAEVATSVLHNVGNVLNSMNVSTGLLADRAANSKLTDLGRVVKLLDQHRADLGGFITADPKGRQLPAYLEALAQQLAADKAFLVEELGALSKNVEHIKTIIAMQQSYAKVAGVAETLPAAELLEDALRFNSGALERHKVELVREYEPDLPPITVDKHKVLQILVNLVRNAKYACDESRRNDKRLTVGVANSNGTLKLRVADNGVGIPPENLTRIFNLGFSTREGGHGFGLHSSALAARELGGSLRVESPGPGLGATFTLELPLSEPNPPKPE